MTCRTSQTWAKIENGGETEAQPSKKKQQKKKQKRAPMKEPNEQGTTSTRKD